MIKVNLGLNDVIHNAPRTCVVPRPGRGIHRSICEATSMDPAVKPRDDGIVVGPLSFALNNNLDKNSSLYYQAARALKLPAKILPCIGGFELKLGWRRYFFRGGYTPFNCGSSISVAENKCCMNKLLDAAGFPVPNMSALAGDAFAADNLEEQLGNLTFPLVVKPARGGLGKDVLCNINSMEKLRFYLQEYYQDYQYLSVEEFHGGMNAWRVLVFYNQVIGVVQRFSARVKGDGIHTIVELIDLANIAREKLKDTVSLGPIHVDAEYLIRLEELGMTLETIPEDQQEVVLCYTCNSTRGGTMKGMGKAIHPENARMLCRAAKALELNLVGFDVQCEDILKPISTSGGVIIEANHNPDISIHECPMSGVSRQVSIIIMRRLIWRHPVAWALGLFRTGHGRFYAKSMLLLSGTLAWKWIASV